MALVIFGDSFTFPEGNASTNRVYTYAKGFIENGIKVHVICFENEFLKNYDGNTDGIFYYHPLAQIKRSDSLFARRWFYFKKYFNALHLIRKLNKEDKIIAINLWTYRLLTQIWAFVLARSIKTHLVLERSEHPLRTYKEDALSQFLGNLRLRSEIKLYDGIFCISNYLIDFYDKRGFDKQRLFLVPSTVDTGRFETPFPPPLPYDYILYCGSLTLIKDGVDILIKSFSSISDKHSSINLVLIGKGDTYEDELNIRELVGSLKLGSRIFFLGQLPRTEIPPYLVNAKILALARPKSKIADAGFPSKLTEYLCTGNPVVVTKVGEIPVFLKDKENAFLSDPDSVDDFAEKLNYVIENYGFAKEVGMRGKVLTTTLFNYNFQAKRMLSFIESLNHNNT